jgi:hypothetical protein
VTVSGPVYPEMLRLILGNAQIDTRKCSDCIERGPENRIQCFAAPVSETPFGAPRFKRLGRLKEARSEMHKDRGGDPPVQMDPPHTIEEQYLISHAC